MAHVKVRTTALALLLPGCATNWYTAPATSPTANFRVVALNSEPYFAWTRYVSETCSRDSPNFPVIGADAKADAEKLDMPGYSGPRGDRFERRIKAGVPFAFTASTLRRVGITEAALTGGSYAGKEYQRQQAWSCNLRVEFVPSAGVNYEATYDFERGRCDLRIEELIASGGAITRRPVPLKVEPAKCGTATVGSG